MTDEPMTNGGRDPRPPASGPDGRAGVEWEPALVEEAVLLALRDHPRERSFRRERDRLYENRDPEAREVAFRDLHARWFDNLDLGLPIAEALREQGVLPARAQGCRVALARSRHEEGAELFVRPAGSGRPEPEARWIVIRLRPETLGSPDHLLQFLRHELTHIADMLDPRFGYEPRLPSSPAGPAHERLLQERYRVLWDTAIDGRLARLGRAPGSARELRLREFSRTFPMLGEKIEEAFAQFFDATILTHAELVGFSTNPASQISNPPAGPRPGDRCPLCRFPTYAFQPDPDLLPTEALSRIQDDFPEWVPALGLCQQCADLYGSRSLQGSWRTPGAA